MSNTPATSHGLCKCAALRCQKSCHHADPDRTRSPVSLQTVAAAERNTDTVQHRCLRGCKSNYPAHRRVAPNLAHQTSRACGGQNLLSGLEKAALRTRRPQVVLLLLLGQPSSMVGTVVPRSSLRSRILGNCATDRRQPARTCTLQCVATHTPAETMTMAAESRTSESAERAQCAQKQPASRHKTSQAVIASNTGSFASRTAQDALSTHVPLKYTAPLLKR